MNKIRPTMFEKHRKKGYEEWIRELKSKFKYVYSTEYKGYTIITFSLENKGCGYKIFKDNLLVRERRYSWYSDILGHVLRYIDDEKVVSQN